MNIINFFIQTKYLVMMFLILIGLFVILSYLVTIPGNKKLKTMSTEKEEKNAIKKSRQAAVKTSVVILLILIIIAMLMNLSIFR